MCGYAQCCAFISVIELPRIPAYCPKANGTFKNDPDKEFDELRFAVDNDGTNILVIINKGEIAMMMK